MRLEEIMTKGVIGIGPDTTADAAWLRMDRKGIRHLVVKEGSRLIGQIARPATAPRAEAR